MRAEHEQTLYTTYTGRRHRCARGRWRSRRCEMRVEHMDMRVARRALLPLRPVLATYASRGSTLRCEFASIIGVYNRRL